MEFYKLNPCEDKEFKKLPLVIPLNGYIVRILETYEHFVIITFLIGKQSMIFRILK